MGDPRLGDPTLNTAKASTFSRDSPSYCIESSPSICLAYLSMRPFTQTHTSSVASSGHFESNPRHHSFQSSIPPQHYQQATPPAYQLPSPEVSLTLQRTYSPASLPNPPVPSVAPAVPGPFPLPHGHNVQSFHPSHPPSHVHENFILPPWPNSGTFQAPATEPAPPPRVTLTAPGPLQAPGQSQT